ncbi:MAG: 30S ribosomal protein S6 [Candidatus Melainabacteria bacterium RIFCSPHIGHO2_02_FULL_34_12]|nr:MAG: 30S ribosomal protein S6 [Candidatus Melainabacteria bacterium RIFCSPHIGHO2_02_FULL_34_12]
MQKAPVKNLYEALIIIKPNLSDDDIEKNISQVESAIKNYGGNIVRIEEPVRRKFTHKIKSFKEGYYISFLFNAPPESPNTLKRTLIISDDVLRHVVLRREN